MFKRILLPLDSSILAECVLPHLVAIARICEPEEQLLRVSEPFGVTARLRMIDPVDWQIRKAEAGSYLSDIASRLQNAGLRVSTQLHDGKPAEQIIEVAHSWNADLILMSSHGQSGISPWNVSSVVQQVILRAHRSLMIIRAYQPLTADLTSLRYHKIFLLLDGSQRAEMPLTLAESLGRGSHGLVNLLAGGERPRREADRAARRRAQVLVDERRALQAGPGEDTVVDVEQRADIAGVVAVSTVIDRTATRRSSRVSSAR